MLWCFKYIYDSVWGCIHGFPRMHAAHRVQGGHTSMDIVSKSLLLMAAILDTWCVLTHTHGFSHTEIRIFPVLYAEWRSRGHQFPKIWQMLWRHGLNEVHGSAIWSLSVHTDTKRIIASKVHTWRMKTTLWDFKVIFIFPIGQWSELDLPWVCGCTDSGPEVSLCCD